VNNKDEIEFGTLPNSEFELIIITINVTRDSFVRRRLLDCFLFELLLEVFGEFIAVVCVDNALTVSLFGILGLLGGSVLPFSASAIPFKLSF
jgi:hypothetical protein